MFRRSVTFFRVRPSKDDWLVLRRPAKKQNWTSAYKQAKKRKIPVTLSHCASSLAKIRFQKEPPRYTRQAKCHVVHRRIDTGCSKWKLLIFCYKRVWISAVWSDLASHRAVSHSHTTPCAGFFVAFCHDKCTLRRGFRPLTLEHQRGLRSRRCTFAKRIRFRWQTGRKRVRWFVRKRLKSKLRTLTKSSAATVIRCALFISLFYCKGRAHGGAWYWRTFFSYKMLLVSLAEVALRKYDAKEKLLNVSRFC